MSSELLNIKKCIWSDCYISFNCNCFYIIRIQTNTSLYCCITLPE